MLNKKCVYIGSRLTLTSKIKMFYVKLFYLEAHSSPSRGRCVIPYVFNLHVSIYIYIYIY